MSDEKASQLMLSSLADPQLRQPPCRRRRNSPTRRSYGLVELLLLLLRRRRRLLLLLYTSTLQQQQWQQQKWLLRLLIQLLLLLLLLLLPLLLTSLLGVWDAMVTIQTNSKSYTWWLLVRIVMRRATSVGYWLPTLRPDDGFGDPPQGAIRNHSVVMLKGRKTIKETMCCLFQLIMSCALCI